MTRAGGGDVFQGVEQEGWRGNQERIGASGNHPVGRRGCPGPGRLIEDSPWGG